MHRTQDTYPLSHFRQHTGDHLRRLEEGRIETITQNGEAAMVVMSPETYDSLRYALERERLWDQAIAQIGEGKGRDAREVIHEIAEEMGFKL